MSFKDAFPEPSWTGIGKHIGQIVQRQLTEQGITHEELARRIGLPNPAFIAEYLQQYSLGVFFPEVEKYLELKPSDIIAKPDEMTELRKYLTTWHHESITHLLTIPPGKKLRTHAIHYVKKQIGSLANEWENICRGLEISGPPPSDDDAFIEKMLLEQPIENLNMIFVPYDICIDELLPLRNPTEAERYEIYTRITTDKGNILAHGHTVDGKHIRATDETEYIMGTFLAIGFTLYTKIAELMKDTSPP